MIILRAIIPALFFCLLLLGIDAYSSNAIQNIFAQYFPNLGTFPLTFWKASSWFFLVSFVLILVVAGSNKNSRPISRLIIPLILFISIPKLIFSSFLLLEDLSRYAEAAWHRYTMGGWHLPFRHNTFGLVALLLSIYPPLLLLYGIFNKYKYRYFRYNIKIDNLPEELKGLKVVQFSDAHLGSLNRPKKVMKGIEMINKEKPDLIFFTGDLVNNLANETDKFTECLSALKCKHGIFSILGNHDYADYYYFSNKEDKLKNIQSLIHKQESYGWRVLMDENEILKIGNSLISIVGIQNWSALPQFTKYGNLPKAYVGSEKGDLQLLLSHDPTHWDAEVRKNFPNIDVMFAGHTHGMQFGFEAFGFKISPSQLMFKQWAGLYQEGKQYLLVNRGFGVVGYPGRIGIMPEISVVTFE